MCKVQNRFSNFIQKKNLHQHLIRKSHHKKALIISCKLYIIEMKTIIFPCLSFKQSELLSELIQASQ